MKTADSPRADRLHAMPFFGRLSASDRRHIADQVIEIRYRKGQPIFQEEDQARYLHILNEGAVKCVQSSRDGKEIVLKVLLPGDLFCCEGAAVGGLARSRCAWPMGDVSVLRLDRRSYFEILRRNPDSALDVIEYLGKRLHEAQENTKVLVLDPAGRRVAALLLRLASRTGVQEPDGLRLAIWLTRQDIADMAGLALETAIRVMGRLKRARLVSGTAKRLLIVDLPGLQRLASSD